MGNPDKKKVQKKLTAKELKAREAHLKKLELLAQMEDDEQDEKARLAELQMQSDFEHAEDLFGPAEVPKEEMVKPVEVTVLNFKPADTAADFKKLAQMMTDLHLEHHKSRHYPTFVK